jgi:hypothetical protein
MFHEEYVFSVRLQFSKKLKTRLFLNKTTIRQFIVSNRSWPPGRNRNIKYKTKIFIDINYVKMWHALFSLNKVLYFNVTLKHKDYYAIYTRVCNTFSTKQNV